MNHHLICLTTDKGNAVSIVSNLAEAQLKGAFIRGSMKIGFVLNSQRVNTPGGGKRNWLRKSDCVKLRAAGFTRQLSDLDNFRMDSCEFWDVFFFVTSLCTSVFGYEYNTRCPALGSLINYGGALLNIDRIMVPEN